LSSDQASDYQGLDKLAILYEANSRFQVPSVT
jgi:hypothetical protein